MAKISFFLFVVALIAFLNVYEAHRVGKFDEEFEKDLHKAEAMIAEELNATEKHIQGLTSKVKKLSKSEGMLNEIGDAYRNNEDLAPYEKKLNKFSRAITPKKNPPAPAKKPAAPKKPAPPAKKKPVSIIQNILRDLGLNGGRT